MIAQPLRKPLSLNNIEVIYDRIALAIKGVSIDVPRGRHGGAAGRQRRRQEHALKSISGLLAAERGEVTRGELQLPRPQHRLRCRRRSASSSASSRCSRAGACSSI